MPIDHLASARSSCSFGQLGNRSFPWLWVFRFRARNLCCAVHIIVTHHRAEGAMPLEGRRHANLLTFRTMRRVPALAPHTLDVCLDACRTPTSHSWTPVCRAGPRCRRCGHDPFHHGQLDLAGLRGTTLRGFIQRRPSPQSQLLSFRFCLSCPPALALANGTLLAVFRGWCCPSRQAGWTTRSCPNGGPESRVAQAVI